MANPKAAIFGDIKNAMKVLVQFAKQYPDADHNLTPQEIDQLVDELQELQQELVRLREESAPRVKRSADGSPICGIIEQDIHAKGQAALTWLEGRQMVKTDRGGS